MVKSHPNRIIVTLLRYLEKDDEIEAWIVINYDDIHRAPRICVVPQVEGVVRRRIGSSAHNNSLSANEISSSTSHNDN
ncbi:hypothetical protein R6Q59_001884, partial [Mikania micrantha]